ncbi:MAG: hypothetical protein JW908_11160 [Anaerolineales bacterium]|nr:hypothetical protein [Anaerolineales bacterium]
MSQFHSVLSSKKRPAFMILIVAFITGSCQLFTPSSPHHYDHPVFSFDYPSDWQTMEELWGFTQSDDNYYGLGFQEIIMVTSAQKKGKFGAYFAVAVKALPEGETVETVFHQTYSQVKDGIREESETTANLNGIPALVKNYERASGEPWWQFQDVWLEKEGTIYLLSFHCLSLGEQYQENLDFILNSFSFK